MVIFESKKVEKLMQKMLTYWNKKLIQPMKRQYRDPRYLARATSIGMGLAFAPFPGQIPVVAAIWVLARKLKWRFSLVVSLAWTFISNVFTNLPLFYLYYLVGNFLRGKKDVLSYGSIQARFDSGLFYGIKDVATELGLSIVLGSCVFMFVFGILGYFFGYWCGVRNKKTSG